MLIEVFPRKDVNNFIIRFRCIHCIFWDGNKKTVLSDCYQWTLRRKRTWQSKEVENLRGRENKYCNSTFKVIKIQYLLLQHLYIYHLSKTLIFANQIL